MLIPPELEKELIEFAFIIDNNKKVEEVYLSKGMATILKPYSTTVQEGRYAYVEIANELYHIEMDEEKDTSKLIAKGFNFENELHHRVSLIYDFTDKPLSCNHVISNIKQLLANPDYKLSDKDEFDITDFIEDFNYCRAILIKRINERENHNDLEEIARLFVTDVSSSKWKDRHSFVALTDYKNLDPTLQQNIAFRTYKFEEGFEYQSFWVLLEDRIIKLNYTSNKFDFEGESDLLDVETYLFTDNATIKEFDVPATPEGFLLLKMMEI
ncbi:hypothetical protein L1887_51130 [Cichorium endivia]|nr:hypothetical protein L1887_51130 [Cichorium endivia]